MSLRTVAAILLLLLFPFSALCGKGAISIGTYLLPPIEAEILLSRWLQQQKYSVDSYPQANSETLLQGTKERSSIRILLRPYSPLATELELVDSAGQEKVDDIRTSWGLFLENAGQLGGSPIPKSVRAMTEAVACINVPQGGGKKMNFTGFLIDGGGTVLTIAHDIDELRLFKIFFSGGKVAEGLALRHDSAKDLSVIESDHRGYSTYFSLKDGRSKVGFGERIFMLCCTESGTVQIQSGRVDKPKAKVGNQTLLQVKLEQVFFGSSGSPVVDEKGRLVGVVKGRFRGADSRGFLIPLDTVNSFIRMGKK